MYSLFSHNRTILTQLFALVVALFVVFAPAASTFAEETGEPEEEYVEEVQEEEQTEEASDGETAQPGDDGTDTEDGESGENGDDANTGGNTDEQEGDAVVQTGDATAVSETQTIANTNDTEINTEGEVEGTEEEEPVQSEEEDTPEENTNEETETTEVYVTEDEEDENSESEEESIENEEGEDPLEGVEIIEGETEVKNDNDGVVANAQETIAETGTNNAGARAGNAVVDTGDALAVANLTNIVNTNIYNSNGFVLLLNSLFGNASLDLRNLDFFSTVEESQSNQPEESPCSGGECISSNATTTITNTNDAEIVNDVIVRANTGSNSAESTSGNAAAVTGDAHAAANVLNVANTNIVDSNYLLLSFNNIGAFGGDIVLPGASFFETFFNGSGLTSPTGDTTVTNTNAATVDTNVSIGADTGGNTVTGASATAVTGDAHAHASVVNNVNTNLFNTDSFSVLFRVYGDWTGDIFGLPDGISWTETDQGIQLFSEDDGVGASSLPANLNVSNTNTAAITNNVSVYALTGDNEVSAGAGDAHVGTGDAHAAASVVNIANTNVVGRNWIFAIFNIFGDFTGNISFGQPDLLLLSSAYSPEHRIGPGSDVRYTFTVTNRGDADATNVRLTSRHNAHLMSFNHYDLGPQGDTPTTWYLPNIPAGETIEVMYRSTVTPGLGNGETPIETEFTVTSQETDANPEDNTDALTILAFKQAVESYGGEHYKLTKDADLNITKVAATTTPLMEGDMRDFTVTVKNDGGTAYHAVLFDTLINDDTGEVVSNRSWELDEIAEGEEVMLTYSAVFNKAGHYTNYAQVKAIQRHPQITPVFVGSFAESGVASTSVAVMVDEEEPEGQVAGASQCELYLDQYLKVESENDELNVMKLQQFLLAAEGHEEVSVTGIFDTITDRAVRLFQEKYRADILDPWGINVPTGYVYYTTQKKINEMYCAYTREFPLTDEQQQEIAEYRGTAEYIRDTEIEIVLPEVGVEDTENNQESAAGESDSADSVSQEEESTLGVQATAGTL